MAGTADLRARIERIKQAGTHIRNETTSAVAKDNISQLIEEGLSSRGWRKEAEYVYSLTTIRKNELPQIVSDFLGPAESPAGNFVFYDCETTGVSGGAGTVVFLCGFGIPEGNDFRIIQYLMTDFPGEPDFLRFLSEYISTDRIYVSYNGKSFDSGILKSRFLLNAMKADFGYQLDLLYPSRRLWKSITGSCSLGDIERNILNKKREHDVPGAFVPDYYFDFIKSGNFEYLRDIAAHHLEDICSLMEILSLIEKLYKNTLRPQEPEVPRDTTGLARMLLDHDDERGALLLESAFSDGDYRAGKYLGQFYKSRADYANAVRIWQRLWNEYRSIDAAIETAKYFEHVVKDSEKAFEITEEILSIEKFRIKKYLAEIKHRNQRLLNKTKNK